MIDTWAEGLLISELHDSLLHESEVIGSDSFARYQSFFKAQATRTEGSNGQQPEPSQKDSSF